MQITDKQPIVIDSIAKELRHPKNSVLETLITRRLNLMPQQT